MGILKQGFRVFYNKVIRVGLEGTSKSTVRKCINKVTLSGYKVGDVSLGVLVVCSLLVV